MKVRFLGTNGWFDSDTGNTICTLIEADGRHVALDAGNGIHKLGRFASGASVDLFLSHYHFDHIEGLHTIVKLPLKGLRIFGMEGTEKALRAIIKKPYTVPLGEGPFPVEVYELPRDRAEAPYLEDFALLEHSDPCMGYRFRLGGLTVAYCTDTGLCDNLIRLGEGRGPAHHGVLRATGPPQRPLAAPEPCGRPRSGGKVRGEKAGPDAF